MIQVSRLDNRAIVRPDGMEMVAGSIPELRVAMRGMIEEGVRELVVDLTDVRMVDSSGIG